MATSMRATSCYLRHHCPSAHLCPVRCLTSYGSSLRPHRSHFHCPPPCPRRTNNPIPPHARISERDVIPPTQPDVIFTLAGSSDRREHMSSSSPSTSILKTCLEQISPHLLAKERCNHDPRPRKHPSHLPKAVTLNGPMKL